MSKKPETRKSIYFDLNTVAIGDYKMKRQYVYRCIEKYMLDKGFEHPQYSVYESKEPMSKAKVTDILGELSEEYPWLAVFMRDIRVSNVEVRHNLSYVFSENSSNIRDVMVRILSENKQPTEVLINAFLELDNITGTKNTLKDVYHKYKNPEPKNEEENKQVNIIAKECMRQELDEKKRVQETDKHRPIDREPER